MATWGRGGALSSHPMETISGLDVEALNRARISRDARFDGKFYIAVTSTGIYCRPICPSRYAKRSNVRFFGDRKSTRLNSSHSQISYAVFCLKKKKKMNKPSRLLEASRW